MTIKVKRVSEKRAIFLICGNKDEKISVDIFCMERRYPKRIV